MPGLHPQKPVEEIYTLDVVKEIMLGYHRDGKPLPVCMQFCRWRGTADCVCPELCPGQGCPGFKINASNDAEVNALFDADMAAYIQ